MKEENNQAQIEHSENKLNEELKKTENFKENEIKNNNNFPKNLNEIENSSGNKKLKILHFIISSK